MSGIFGIVSKPQPMSSVIFEFFVPTSMSFGEGKKISLTGIVTGEF